MKRLWIIFLASGLTIASFSQNLIGYRKPEITAFMKEEYKDFRISTNTRNPVYRYLKYEDRSNTRTILFFLSEEEICTYVRFIGDYSWLNRSVKELDEKFEKVNDLTWLERKGKQTFLIELEKEEWFYIITIRKSEE